MRTMIGFAVFALVLAAVNVNAQDDAATDLRFAVMVDTTVFPEGVAAVVQHSCSITDVYEAVDDPSQQCHTEAMEMCYQMGDECGGYVIEPASIDLEPEKRISINFNNPFNREPVRVVQADVEYTRERGIVVKIIKAGAAEDINNLVTVAGATLYEKRTIGSDPALLAQMYEQKISEKVDDAIAGHSEIQAIEAEIERRVRKGTLPIIVCMPHETNVLDSGADFDVRVWSTQTPFAIFSSLHVHTIPSVSELREVKPRRILFDVCSIRRQGALGNAR